MNFDDETLTDLIRKLFENKGHIGDPSVPRPWKLLEKAYKEGRIRYRSPLQETLREADLGLESVKVVSPSTLPAVSERAAHVVIDILRQVRARGENHAKIGFSGGLTMWQLSRSLAPLLEKRAASLPRKISFYGLTASFDDTWQAHTRTVGANFLHDGRNDHAVVYAPEVHRFGTGKDRYQFLADYKTQRARQDITEGLHLIMTSLASADDEHSLLRKHYLTQYTGIVEELQNNGWLGDLLWLPINSQGPMELNDDTPRPMTILELSELPVLISRNTKVLVVAGPCAFSGACPCSLKAAVLDALLHLKSRYITHLVVDSQMSASLLDKHMARIGN